MKKLSRMRTAAWIMSLGVLLQSAAYIPANADSNAKVSFNEVCSKNTSYPSSDGNFYDWIELYNNDRNEADISGWGLSDKESEPYRYVFPDGTRIPANGRLLVYCDSDAAATNSRIAPFGLSASGETLILTDKSGNAANTLTFGALASDTSYGQYPDGSGEFYNLSCTPDKANSAPQGSAAVHVPVFSQDSGYYDSSFALTLQADEGCTIYYTTDGSLPTTESEKYTGPITIEDMSETPNRLSKRTDITPDGAEAPRENVDKGAVIRAVSVDSNGNISEPVTKTYFTGKTNSGYYKQMKVVSLVTDPDNLFDNEKGIYCLGKVFEENRNGGRRNSWEYLANYSMKGKEWERPASFTLFENGEKILEQNVGIRIKGNYSRSLPQKSFNIYTRQEYGAAEFDYDFFSGKAVKAKNGKAIKKYDGIVLRNGGNDNTAAFFRDSINQSLITDRAFAYQATTECIVFLDGEFWGIYQLMEKTDDSYISEHYGVKKSDVAIIKNDELEEGTENDLRDWEELCSGVADGRVSYEEFCNKVDVQGFIDYFASQVYWSNADWPQRNVIAWRSDAIDETNPYADGKWRMVLFDTESGQGLYGSEDKSFSADCYRRLRQTDGQLAKMFNGLMNNEEFRLRYSRTLMDLANYNFTPDRTKAVIEGYKNSYKQQVADTFARFHSGSMSGANAERRFENEIATVTDFYAKRYSYAERTTRSAMKLSSEPHKLSIVNPSDCGSIDLNTLKLGDISQWSGYYHSDYEITLSANPKEGNTFSHWNISGAEITKGSADSPVISVKLSADARIEADYGTGSQPATDAPAETTTPAQTGNAKKGKVIQAETCNYKSGIDTENCSEGGLDVAYIENNDYIGFKDIDLTNVNNIDFRIGSDGARASLEIRLDSPEGKVIGRMDVKGTNGWQTWTTQTCNVEKTEGKHDVYFVFKGGEGYLFNINWWRPDSPAVKYTKGDLNGDGKINAYDVCIMRSSAASGEAEIFGAADLNGDDAINADDLKLLNKFILGEIKSF